MQHSLGSATSALIFMIRNSVVLQRNSLSVLYVSRLPSWFGYLGRSGVPQAPTVAADAAATAAASSGGGFELDIVQATKTT